jgi:predicted nucleotidyltransferase
MGEAEMTGKIPEQWFEEIREWAATWPRIAAVYAFGSRAKGEEYAASDLDIAVVLGNDPSESALVFATFNLKEMRSSLASRLPVSIDLQIALPGDAITWPSIEDHGVLIYQIAL